MKLWCDMVELVQGYSGLQDNFMQPTKEPK